MSQSNIQQGNIVLPAKENLTGLEGCLVMIANDSDVAKFALPDTAVDLAMFVLIDGGPQDDNVAARPLSPDCSVRLRLNGACKPGDVLVLEEPDGTHDGKVCKLPASAGTYRAIGLAEEVGVDGQLILARPAMIGLMTVTGA